MYAQDKEKREVHTAPTPGHENENTYTDPVPGINNKDLHATPANDVAPPPLYGEHKEKDLENVATKATVDTASERSMTFGTMLKGDVASRMTVFERKAALINAEIDQMGMGRYQICIWFLTGFGYFLDLSWSQGVGLLATPILQEMFIGDNRSGLLPTLGNAGLAIGAFGFGFSVDIIGRKWAFNLTCLITSIFGTLIAAPKYNWEAVCALYFLSCIGLGGNIPIDALIALEFLPQNRRFLVSLLSMWQPIGVTVASGIAYGTVARYRCDPELPSCVAEDPDYTPGEPCCSVSSNMGWRYLVIVLGAMTLTIFFLRFVVFKFHESPKFLLSKGKEQEAIDVLNRIAKFNKQPPVQLTVEHFRAIDIDAGVDLAVVENSRPLTWRESTVKAWNNFKDSMVKLTGLFKNRVQTFIFILLAVVYMGDYWSFNLAGYFLPIILQRTNTSEGRGTVEDTYRQYVYIYLPGIIGAVLALLSVQLPLLGRKWSLVLSGILQGLGMAMYTQVNSTAGYVGLNAFAYVMQTYFNAVLYASAPELFATAYRGSASGMLSALGRIAGIVAPFAGQHFLAEDSSGILWLGAGGIWLAAVCCIFIPVEMRSRQMF